MFFNSILPFLKKRLPVNKGFLLKDFNGFIDKNMMCTDQQRNLFYLAFKLSGVGLLRTAGGSTKENVWIHQRENAKNKWKKDKNNIQQSNKEVQQTNKEMQQQKKLKTNKQKIISWVGLYRRKEEEKQTKVTKKRNPTKNATHKQMVSWMVCLRWW